VVTVSIAVLIDALVQRPELQRIWSPAGQTVGAPGWQYKRYCTSAERKNRMKQSTADAGHTEPLSLSKRLLELLLHWPPSPKQQMSEEEEEKKKKKSE
jgi:hypothetical protein